VGDACADQGFYLWRARHVPVHGACKIVFPLDPGRNFLVFCEVEGLQVQCTDLGNQLLFLIIIGDSPKPVNIILAVDLKKRKKKGQMKTIQSWKQNGELRNESMCMWN
jgi:hypothetical protein